MTRAVALVALLFSSSMYVYSCQYILFISHTFLLCNLPVSVRPSVVWHWLFFQRSSGQTGQRVPRAKRNLSVDFFLFIPFLFMFFFFLRWAGNVRAHALFFFYFLQTRTHAQTALHDGSCWVFDPVECNVVVIKKCCIPSLPMRKNWCGENIVTILE